MRTYYYIDRHGHRQGPVAQSDLVRGGLTPDTMVWTQGMTDWQRAATVAELAPFLAAPAAPHAAAPTAHGYAPSDYQLWALLVTIGSIVFCSLFALLFALLALRQSGRVERLWLTGQQEAAFRASSRARMWCIAATVLLVVGGLATGGWVLRHFEGFFG